MHQAKMRSRTSVVATMLLIILAIIIGGPSGGGRAHSATAMPMTFTVTNLDDSGPGSLRDAIDQANMNPGPDVIDFQDELSGTITLTSGELFITEDLTINGPGVFSIIVSGNHASRVFEVLSGVTAEISGLTISNGAGFEGGGVYNGGTLTLTSVVLSDNSVQVSVGGGIFNAALATLTIINSTVSGNSAAAGGGIYNTSLATLTITNSTFSGNSASIGGGINNSAGTLTITNSTVSDNSASSQGGGIVNSGGTASISFTTLSENSASLGGGIANGTGTMNIKNSIVANSPTGGDCSNSGTFNASGTNFTTNGTCPGFTQVTPAQLNLGPLQDNGGPTQTHALLPGSVAIDAAPDCTDIDSNPVSTDQRGVGRPQGKACDVGAYEFVPCTVQPTISCPDDFSVSTDPGQCSAMVDYSLPPADCPCSNGGSAALLRKGAAIKKSNALQDASCSVSCTPPPRSTFPKGTSTVTCTVTDAFGNTAQCSFHITVNDSPPILNCPASVTQSTDPNKCTAVVNYTVTAIDDCDGPVTPSCSPPSGSTFQKGTTTVTCTATDSLKQQSSCSFPVNVNDTQPPSITCPANITTKTPQSGNGCVVVNYTTPTATDNCPLPPNPVSCTPPSGSCFARGTTTVTCTAIDASGNIATCSFKVSVFDICLQDDSNPLIVVFVNSATGDYRFCCNGTVFTGKGKVTIRGSVYTLEHNATDRRVVATDDESTHKGSASLQVPVGTTRCTISDRDTRNNTCLCQ